MAVASFFQQLLDNILGTPYLSWNRQVALHKRGKTEFLSRFS